MVGDNTATSLNGPHNVELTLKPKTYLSDALCEQLHWNEWAAMLYPGDLFWTLADQQPSSSVQMATVATLATAGGQNIQEAN